jgi:hypothetical protein
VGLNHIFVHAFDLDMFVFNGFLVVLIDVLRNPKPFLKVFLNAIGPFSERVDLIVQFDSVKLYFPLIVKLIKLSEAELEQAYQLYRNTITRCSRATLGLSPLRRAHFVHPCETIIDISACDKTCVSIHL